MKVKYFQDTDTLYVEFSAAAISATRDLDENTTLDVNKDGNLSGGLDYAAIARHWFMALSKS